MSREPLSLIHGGRRNRSNQTYTRGFKLPQKGLGCPEIIRGRGEGSPTPGGQRRFPGESDDPAEDRTLQTEEIVHAKALCQGQEEAGEGGRQGHPQGHCVSNTEDLCLFHNSSGSSGKVGGGQIQGCDMVWP